MGKCIQYDIKNIKDTTIMQLTSLIGKQILSPAGEHIGYVLAARPSRDLKKVSCLVCADENEEEFFLPVKNVLSFGDALIAQHTHAAAPSGIPCPISSAVYSSEGERIGTLGELLIGEDADPLFIVHEDGAKFTYPLSRVALGDSIIVYAEGCKKPAAVKKPARKPAEKKPQKQKTVAPPHKKETETGTAASTANAEDALNRLNLLGRRLKKSVYDENGYPIALAGERITKNIVSLARRSNRLLQLTVNTLTNVM